MGFNLNSVRDWSESVQNFLRLGKAAVEQMPDGPARNEVQAALDRAREQSLQAEVQLANSMGYKLCKQHRPPEVMVSIGREPKWNIERFKCGSCGSIEPSDHFFRSLDRDSSAA